MRFLASLFLVLFFACTVSAGEIAVDVTEVLLENKISRTMDIPNPDGALSRMTFIDGDRAYIKFWSSISSSDNTDLWSDLAILEYSTEIRTIQMLVSSPGGSAFDGLAISGQILRARKKGFTFAAYASGIVASAAVPVFAVADYRIADPGAIFMVHQAAIWKWPGMETRSQIESQTKMLEILRKRYIKLLTDNSTIDAEKWEKMQEETTWFTAQQALLWGLVDKLE